MRKSFLSVPVATLGIVLSGALSSHAQVTQSDLGRYRQWGFETITQIESDLGRPNSELYYEGRKIDGSLLDGNELPLAFVWPLATQFRAYVAYVASNPDPNDNPSYNDNPTQHLRRLSDQAKQSYWVNSGSRGYGVYPGSSERFYDDNAHWTVSLVEAYQVTGDPIYLSRAQETHDFVMSGEKSTGGIYFKTTSTGAANTVSTLQAARGAAMLYTETGQQRYLDEATRLLEWSEANVQAPDGTYYQDARSPINVNENTPLTNAAGMGILTNLELYDITGDEDYLTEAQRVATSMESRYFQGRIRQEGYWAFEAVEALLELYEHDNNEYWLVETSEGIEVLQADVKDLNGRYGPNWRNIYSDQEREKWYLNDQASVARAYLRIGLTELYVEPIPEPGTAALFTLVAPTLLMRRRRMA